MERELAAELTAPSSDILNSGPASDENPPLSTSPIPPSDDDLAMDIDDQAAPQEYANHPAVEAISATTPSAEGNLPLPSRRATVEDVEDEDDPRNRARYVEDWPGNAGTIKGTGLGVFEAHQRERQRDGREPWYPFESKEEWELAKWIMSSGISQAKTNDFLKLSSVRKGINPAFHNSRSFYQRIDALPEGPEWTCSPLRIVGDRLDENGNPWTEDVDLWHRDPIACIKELIANPAFKDAMAYAPYRVFRDAEAMNREYSEMWTGEWWWRLQALLPDGATIVPVILSSDKTNLTRFSGDKQAWPVYLSIGNISKSTRRKANSRAMVLLGYIPVCKLDCFTKKRRSVEGYRFFHDCMKIFLASLREAGQKGVDVACADGFIRTIFPILAAYIADYPEQCLVACCKENSCPTCTVDPDDRGEYRVHSVLRDPEKTIDILEERANGDAPEEFNDESLRPVDPFWRDLPHCNIFACITPDLLHQLHKGLFKDHIVSWATEACNGGEDEIDERFRTMSTHPSLRHFKKGISVTTQWTGREHKNMEKVFLGVLAGSTDVRVLQSVQGVLDFIYYAHFETHTDRSLQMLDAAWLKFHQNKEIFEELGIRQHFNISKLHNIKHYLDSIRLLGTADGYNTESSERLHIDLAKMGYNASNKKEYIKQMTVWLRRQEAVHRFDQFLAWTVPGYGGEGDIEEEGEEEMVGEEESDETDQAADNNQQSLISFAKKPPIVGVTVSSLAEDYGAAKFLPHLTTFIRDAIPSYTGTLAPTTTFALYKQFVLTLPAIPEVSLLPLRDVVHAVKGSPEIHTTRGTKQAVSARFSTVLVRVPEVKDDNSPLNGIRAAQVRVIFRLPDVFGYPHVLAYVHWFTPFRHPTPETGMFSIKHSTRRHARNASVIPINDILRSCHLIPAFGSSQATTRKWSSESVLEQASSFYLNPYLRHYDFYYLRYRVDLHIQREQDRQDALEEQRARARAATRGRNR
ncbi:hypothetical protein CVT26_004943 [Gymnopilus dilepis]|uniref:Uncharacterized protein n=1 Tax=Gymnopilus dilepis TaxID=231916 RepID=A0A409WWU9_9AGAR|nr:hypothetical protein CVT26_004943 [Gymnopilus dilepis]